MKGKLLIFSAPSGSGKSTIVHHLLQAFPQIEFSISATSRQPRGKEKDGVDYYFLSADEFRRRIENGDFLEWEEVYTDRYYGTLRSEVERIWNKGHHVIFDIDVEGGINLKKQFGDRALSIFVQAPGIDVLEKRLRGRGTDSEEVIQQRLAKAESEMQKAPEFDIILVNDDLQKALNRAEELVGNFIEPS